MTNQKNHKIALGCGLFVFLLVIIIVISLVTCTGNGDSDPPVDLEASVTFDGTQFHITNNNDFAWTEAKFTLNETYYYTASINMEPKTEYTIGAAVFSKKDGTRFNPFTQKFNRMFIMVKTEDGYISAAFVGK
jgi:uncharacterized membrane-anchored protein YitT (DUF2179 family)